MDTPSEASSDVPETKFSLQNQKFMLTYKTHLNKTMVTRFLTGVFKKGCKFLRCAHEKADDEAPYEHTHILIDVGSRFQSKNARIFDYDDIHPHIKLIKTKTHWDNSLEYLAKEDTENADLKKGKILTLLTNCLTASDAIQLCQKFSDVPGALAGFNALRKPTFTPVENWTPYKWQQQLIDIIDGPIDNRKIIWVNDPPGRGGKTELCKYLSVDGKAVSCTAPGGAYHFTTLVQGWFNEGWNGRCCLFNLTRTQEDHNIYGPLESVKDGLMSSQKYQGRTMVFNSPHVIVFANWWPEVDKLSLDRWELLKLEDGTLNITSVPDARAERKAEIERRFALGTKAPFGAN